MNSHPAFLRFSKIVLVNVFLVILAGGIVRTTQSGMGCPDWPKCFGRWIPPTTVNQLPVNYKDLYAFKYADTSFNAYHTWVEYINRLLGAILGLLLMGLFLWSFIYWKAKRKIVGLSLALLILTGFQGWLGSKVVEANLEVVKVTTHMLVALIIAALSITIIYFATPRRVIIDNKELKSFSLFTIVLLLIQIVLGTQVREQIDHISLASQFTQRETWVSKLDYVFYMHRTFSLIVAAACIYLFFQYKKFPRLKQSTYLILACVLLTIVLGITLNYLNFPAFAQPLHLLLATVLISSLFYNFLTTA